MKRRYTSKRDREELKHRQDNKCACCGESLQEGRYHIDHFIPVSPVLGGGNTLANKQILCIRCHWQKTRIDNRNIKKVRHLTGERRSSETPFPGSLSTPWKRRLTSAGRKTIRRGA